MMYAVRERGATHDAVWVEAPDDRVALFVCEQAGFVNPEIIEFQPLRESFFEVLQNRRRSRRFLGPKMTLGTILLIVLLVLLLGGGGGWYNGNWGGGPVGGIGLIFVIVLVLVLLGRI